MVSRPRLAAMPPIDIIQVGIEADKKTNDEVNNK